MVGVAQSVELWIVAPAVAGSNPVAHPIFFNMEKDIKSCLSAGFTDYIVKPINIPKFLEKIDKLLT